MSEPKPKAKRSWIIFPWLLAIVLVVGWSGYWFYARGQIETKLDAQVEALRGAGYVVDVERRPVAGYPFRFFIRAGSMRVTAPAGWTLEAPRLEAAISAINPDVTVITAPDGFTWSPRGAAPIAVTGEVLRMSLGGLRGGAPYRVSLEAQEADLASSQPLSMPFSAVERFEAHFRPGQDDSARILFRLDGAEPSGEGLLSRIAGTVPISLGIEGELRQASALRGKTWSEWLQSWSAADGRLLLEQGGLQAGPLSISLRPGRVGVTPEGLADGALNLSLDRPMDGVLALGELGVLPRETAAVASGVAGAQSALSGDEVLNLDFDFENGEAYLGLIPLGPAPRVYTPRP